MKHHPYKNKWFVILAVLITGLLKFLFAEWLELRVFYITAACLFWLIFILAKYKKNPLVLKRWGFQKHNFGKSLLYLLPFGLIFTTGIIIYAFLFTDAHRSWHIFPILGLYPLWGIIQQFIVAGLVAGNLKLLADGKISDTQVNFIISFLFAMVHYPSTPLMLYVFVMEFVFLKAYFKYNNLWALGLFHGWVSGLFLFFVVERDLWSELLRIFQ